jgi:uncharacterized protein (TIGR00369 family)
MACVWKTRVIGLRSRQNSVWAVSAMGEHAGMTDDLAALVELMPFAASLGMELERADAGEVRGRLAWAPELCTTGGLVHGGALMAFADSLGGVCAFLNLPAGATTATTSSSTIFMRGVREGWVLGVARPLHVGRTTIAVVTELLDERERRLAQVTQTQAVLQGAPSG